MGFFAKKMRFFLATKHRREKIYVAFPFDFLGYQTLSLIIFLFLFKFISKKSKEIVVVLMIRKRKKIQYPRERERERAQKKIRVKCQPEYIFLPVTWVGSIVSGTQREGIYFQNIL